MKETNLPDALTLCEALAGPEQDSWHGTILEELVAIREAGTWTLVDHTPKIQNIVGVRSGSPTTIVNACGGVALRHNSVVALVKISTQPVS